ncbi:unnamed protein product [Toxocara canis]|uniref:G_PROTEIN_RECEP_F1_2 domain-containing protein n=1 Tax=Toxocara canis TaxID=6265 RepID=A0A183UGB9_TOXCA|nr:unnamed protein product [Toxocara canis]
MPLMAMNSTALKQLCDKHGDVIGQQNVLLGLVYVCSGIVYITLQLLCIYAIFQKDLLRNSCFKIMLAMCVTDVLSLSFSGIFTGFLSIIGASICSHPVLLSIGGHVGFGLWCCYAMLCTILGLNRFLDLLYPMFYRPLFSGRRTWYWLSLPVLYGLYISSPLERPFIYSSRLGSWFISPLPGVLDTGYTILVQTFVTCLILTVATASYVAMQLWPLPDFMYILSQITWQAINGTAFFEEQIIFPKRSESFE